MFSRLKNSQIYFLYNTHEEKAQGRLVLLMHNIFSSLVATLTGGLFYTSFLMTNGINLVDIGIITFVPYIANAFSLFSPVVLERFKKRRWIMAGGRLTYYILNIIGVTLIPILIDDPKLKMFLFIAVVFLANIINVVFSSGYSAWHIKFVPPEIRSEYYSTCSAISGVAIHALSLLVSAIADFFSATPYAYTCIVVMRLLGFVTALVDVTMLCIPVEYPYDQSVQKPRLSHIFTKPLTHKKFSLTMAICFLYYFGANLPLSSLNYYLLNNVGVSYSFIQFLNLLYPLFMFLFMRYWQRTIHSLGWMKSYSLSLLLTFPTVLAYSCVTSANYLWLLTAVRLVQHLTMMGLNLSNSNMLHLNMPKQDQVNYVSFYTIITTLATFLGMLCGTTFVSRFPDLALTIGSLQFTNVQVLMWFEAAFQVFVGVLAFCMAKKLTPDAT